VCAELLNQVKFRHAKVFEKTTDKLPLLLALSDKIVPINVLERRFSVEFPVRTAGVFPKTLNVRELYAHD
jgi:hypothetical protein